MPIELEITKPQKVRAKLLKIHMKVTDGFCAELTDQNDARICDQVDDYVPSFMPGEHYGDYLILDIDIETGQIVNWQKPTPAKLKEWADKCNGLSEPS